jgi:hypothetical protein
MTMKKQSAISSQQSATDAKGVVSVQCLPIADCRLLIAGCGG